METTIYYTDHYTGSEMKLTFGGDMSEICKNVITHLINGAIAFVKTEGEISINREYNSDHDETIRNVCQTAFTMGDVVAIVSGNDGSNFINRVDFSSTVVDGDFTESEDENETESSVETDSE